MENSTEKLVQMERFYWDDEGHLFNSRITVHSDMAVYSRTTQKNRVSGEIRQGQRVRVEIGMDKKTPLWIPEGRLGDYVKHLRDNGYRKVSQPATDAIDWGEASRKSYRPKF